MYSKSRCLKSLKNLALLVVASAVGLSIAEAGARLLGYEPIYAVYSKPSALWTYDPMLGWKHPPGARDTFVGPRPWPIEFRVDVEINSSGQRGPEVRPRAEVFRRVLALGDSLTAAFEVPYDATYAAILQRKLSEELDRPVDVVNAGVRGYGADQSYLFYKSEGHKLQPDVVMLLITGNDAQDSVTLHRMRRPFGKPVFVPEKNGLRLVGVPVPKYDMCTEVVLTPDFDVRQPAGIVTRTMCRLQSRLSDHSALFSLATLALRKNRGLVKSLYRFSDLNRNQHYRDGPRRHAAEHARILTARILAALASSVEADGAKLVLVGYPKHLEELELSAAFLRQVVVVELEPAAFGDRRRLHFKNDAHWNAAGHETFADFILPTVLETLRHAPGSAPQGR